MDCVLLYLSPQIGNLLCRPLVRTLVQLAGSLIDWRQVRLRIEHLIDPLQSGSIGGCTDDEFTFLVSQSGEMSGELRTQVGDWCITARQWQA